MDSSSTLPQFLAMCLVTIGNDETKDTLKDLDGKKRKFTDRRQHNLQRRESKDAERTEGLDAQKRWQKDAETFTEGKQTRERRGDGSKQRESGSSTSP